MKKMMILAAVAAGALLSPTASFATEYPWCAQDRNSGIASCGYVSQGQCLAAISGVGGFCQFNPRFAVPTVVEPRWTKRRVYYELY